jgi:cell division protein FtsI/penicillin-binding protein 2
MRKRDRTIRIRVVAGVLCVVALFLVSRSYYIQVARGAEFSVEANNQYVHSSSGQYTRGSIYYTTRTGERLSAASLRAGYTVAVNPQKVIDATELCQQLVAVLPVERDVCVRRSTLPQRTYVELATRIDEETSNIVRTIESSALHIVPVQWRYYPGGELSSRVVGFVGHTNDSEELRGLYGLEREYDDTLFQTSNLRRVNHFAKLFSDLGEYVPNQKGVGVGDIVTTLEPTVSRMLESTLQQTHEQYDSQLTGAIIMRPDTGAIVAMSAVPGFDANDRAGATIDQFRNPLVENVYEFGSTIKALTVAAGLDGAVITPRSTYVDAGSLSLDGFTIHNFDGRARGEVLVQEILSQSLNTGVSHIVQLLGKERFREYFLRFGLGERSGVDLPNEAPGLVDNLYANTDVEYATASFGQGIAVSPVAATRALASLANGGYLVTPHIGHEIALDTGLTETLEQPESTQVLSARASDEISRMLVTVVDEALRGGGVALPNHTIAAKTGTAQIPDPVNGGYYEDKFLHSFFGYFPAYDPEFIVFLYTVEPQGVRYASETLTEPFMTMTEFLINYYTIPPDR